MSVSVCREEHVPVFNLVGVNHKTLPLEQREIFARMNSDSTALLRSVASHCALDEVAVLSTCNRFEIITAGCESEKNILNFIESRIKKPLELDHFYRLRNEDTLRHFFRVASSLDSMVVGEAQILGQVKDAYRKSAASGYAGKYLHHLFQFAFRLAKKIRTSTGVSEKGISLSYIAVKLAQQIFGDLSGRTVLVIGSGQMGELAAVHLKSYGCDNIIVANRTLERASELAKRLGGSAVSFTEVERYVLQSDVVIGSVSVEQPILKTSSLRERRSNKPVFLIDLGVPRNFPTALGEIDNVYLYDIDDLGKISDENRELREEAARDAEVIIEYGVHQFEKWLRKIAVEPAVVDMRTRVAAVCQSELQKGLENIIESDELSRVLPDLSYRISQKVSHDFSQTCNTCVCKDLDDMSLFPILLDPKADKG